MFVDEESNSNDLVRAVTELTAKVERLCGTPCRRCGRSLCGQQVLFAIVMGLSDGPLCLSCLAHSLDRPAESLRNDLLQYVFRRDCYRTVWQTLKGRVEQSDFAIGAEVSANPDADAAAKPVRESVDSRIGMVSLSQADLLWDADQLACGDLLLQLRLRLRELPAGAILHLIAQDRGAMEDIPAWCRLTGNRMLSADHPHYRIERKSR